MGTYRDMLVASGFTAVWASENTHETIWDAMDRKEVYSTTGPRMMVRFFGGWDYTAEDLNSSLPAFRGYEKGSAAGRRPVLAQTMLPLTHGLCASRMIRSGANLDRIQIIKGWR